MTCRTCGEPLKKYNGGSTTLMYFGSPPGHNHDRNRVVREYICDAGHATMLTKKMVCHAPGCGWSYPSSDGGDVVDSWPGEA